MKLYSVLSLFALTFASAFGDLITVSTPVGDVQGISKTTTFGGIRYNITCFYGVPFAESTEGDRRFAKPVAKAPFAKVYNATKLSPPCARNSMWAGLNIEGTEDCLTLNIFLPGGISQNSKKAVMIFIYGGGFQIGDQNWYISESLPAVNDVIYVTVNYRLSAYGFLASSKHGVKGNYGLWDQHMGIKWVHDNIAAFGGDPNKVTVFGESAGSVSVLFQAMFGGNRGLFQRVIAESGALGTFWSFNENSDKGFDGLVERSGCNKKTSTETLNCLRNKSVSELEMHFSQSPDEWFLPVQDGEFVKYDPETVYKNLTMESSDALANFESLDLIIGLNSDEAHSELKLLGQHGRNLSEIANGMSAELFEQYVKVILTVIRKPTNDAVLKSVIHQYTDWSAPFSAEARRDEFMSVVKDTFYTAQVIPAANAHAVGAVDKKTFLYHFEHKPSFSHTPDWVTGADHHEEIYFVLGFPIVFMYTAGIFSEDPVLDLPDNEQQLVQSMMKYWTQFAKTGDPNDPTDNMISHWPEFTSENQTYIRFLGDGRSFPTASRFRSEHVNYWTDVFPGLRNITGSDNEDCLVGAGAVSNISHVLVFTVVFFLPLIILSNIFNCCC